MMKRMSALALGFWFVLGLMACGTTPVTQVSFDQAALEQENGGLDTSDELPSFGDAVLATEQIEAPAEGTIPTDAEDGAEEAAGRKVFYLHILWGQLRWGDRPGMPPRTERAAPNPAESGRQPTIWDGSLSVTAGAALRILRVIRFEPATDSIVGRSPEKIEWKSSTLPHNDGIIVRVVVGADVGDDVPVLSFATPSLSARLRVSELGGLHRVVDTGNANGDQVAFLATRRPRPCPVGFVAGRWARVDERGGVFEGRWMGHAGGVLGHVRGIWGQRQNGERVLFGKIIGRNGAFIGRLKGRYGDGFFRGVYEGREGQAHGVVYGRYRGEDGRGYFQARWARACPGREGTCQCTAGEPPASSSDVAAPCACEPPAEVPASTDPSQP